MTSTSTIANLDITADLAIDVEGRPLWLRADGGKVVIEIADVSMLGVLGRSGPWQGSLRLRVNSLARLLARASVEAEIRVDGTPLLRMGKGISSVLMSLIGFKNIRICLAPAWTIWRR